MRIDGPQITGSVTIGATQLPDVSALATTGSNLFKGTQTLSGSIIPAVNNIYDLGSPTNQFRHVYISTGSLYIDGTKVLGSTSSELQITTDNGQSFKVLETGADTITLQSADGNVTLTSTGGGDIVMDPSTGVIGLKGTVTIYTGNKIVSSDGNSIQFGNGIAITGSIVATSTNLITGSGQISSLGFATTGSNTFNGNLTVTGYIDAQELRTTYISSSILYRSGSTKFGDELTDTHSFTGSLSISGSLSVPNSNLVSGSSQIDVMSTTNIARLATTGSNTFNGTIKTSGISIGVDPTANILDVRGENSTYDGTIVLGARGTIQHRDSGNTILSIANDYNSDSAKFEIRMKGNTTSDAKFTMLGSGAATFTNNVAVLGSLGVGVSSPGDILDVRKNQNATTNFYFRNTDTTNASSRAYLNVIAGDTTMSMLALHGGDTYLAGTSGRNMYFQQNPGGTVNMFISGSGYVGINESSPTKRLTVNFGTGISDGLLVTGSQRQETRFKSSGEHSNVFIDSAHSNIYLPTLGLQRSSTAYGEMKLQRASNSDALGNFTESEMIVGTTTNTPLSLKVNEERLVILSSSSIRIKSTVLPTADATYNLGSTSYRWNNVYTTDLHLSNKGKTNDVDGTWGDWTLQEGENDLFMINHRSGDKFKIILEKINT